jgi:hypothetical protein
MTKMMSLDQCEYSADMIHIRMGGVGRGVYERFKNAAKESTIETPLRFSPPVILFQEALMTIASIPDVLGAEKTA